MNILKLFIAMVLIVIETIVLVMCAIIATEPGNGFTGLATAAFSFYLYITALFTVLS